MSPLNLSGSTGISGVDGSAGTPAVQGTDTNTGISFPAADTIAFNEGGAEVGRFDSSGRLLVGTSSAPTCTAVFSGRSDGNSSSTVRLQTSATAPANGDPLGVLAFGSAGTTAVKSSAYIYCERDAGTWTNDSSMPGRLVFSTTADGASSPSEAMRIRNSGQVWTISISSSFYTATTQAAGTTYSLFSGSYGASSIGGGTESFRVWSNGNVQNTNNSYTAISDIKLKENIADAGSQWADLKALRVRNYNLKEGQTHRQIGLIAQEVEPISPGLVYESPDRDAEGNDLGTVTKSVNYSVLYMKAVKALQEAMERIEQLETANADLLARVAALESA